MVTKWAIGAENLASLRKRRAGRAFEHRLEMQSAGRLPGWWAASATGFDLGAAILDGVASEINSIDWRGMSLALGGIIMSWVRGYVGAINWREGRTTLVRR